MALETLLGFGNIDSTENINARLAGLIPKGIIKGGMVVPESSNTLQVRLITDPESSFVLLAMSEDGMVVREKTDEHVFEVTAGVANALVLRTQYLPNSAPISELQILSLGDYTNDPSPETLIRICLISPAAGDTAVSTSDIDLSWRDEIEGLSRQVIRGVVNTYQDLPETSGSPAEAEINFLSNTFVGGTTITVGTPTATIAFPLVAAITFPIANNLGLGLTRVNPTQVGINTIIKDPVTGAFIVTTTAGHGFQAGSSVLINGSSATVVNTVWTVVAVLSTISFTINAPSTLFAQVISNMSSNGAVVDHNAAATVTVRLAPNVTHTLLSGDSIAVLGAIDPTFDGSNFTVSTVINSYSFTYLQTGLPSASSGSGAVYKNNLILPVNAVEIGGSSAATAIAFSTAFGAAFELASDIHAQALGSSVKLTATILSEIGNSYTLSKSEPNVLPENQAIAVSQFSGGVSPNANPAGFNSKLKQGDLYVVLHGESGMLELWGFDGVSFTNLTSGSVLDLHRKNLFSNEIHVTDNEKYALQGTKGTPSNTNRFITQQDTSQLSVTLQDALQGADGVPPSVDNKFLTEARIRGETVEIEVPDNQDYVIITPSDYLTWEGLIVSKGKPHNTLLLSLPANKTGITTATIADSSHSNITVDLINGSTVATVLNGVTTLAWKTLGITSDELPANTTILDVKQNVDASISRQFFNLIHSPLVGNLIQGSPVVAIIIGTPLPAMVGTPISGIGIPNGTSIVSVSSTTITLSNMATTSLNAVQLTNDFVEYSQKDFTPVKITNLLISDIQVVANYAIGDTILTVTGGVYNLDVLGKQAAGYGISPNTTILNVTNEISVSLPIFLNVLNSPFTLITTSSGPLHFVGDFTSGSNIIKLSHYVLTDALHNAQVVAPGINSSTTVTAVRNYFTISKPTISASDPKSTIKVFTRELSNDLDITLTPITNTGLFPSLSLPTNASLLVKFSSLPNNGSATLLCSAAIEEKSRFPSSDMLVIPQPIIPAELRDVVNRAQELRFNAGISITTGVHGRNTKILWPANLFNAINLQGFLMSRRFGDQPTALTIGFFLDFEAGTGSQSIVAPFTPISFASSTPTWSKYILTVDQTGAVRTYPLSSLLKRATDLAFSPQINGLSSPCLPFLDGQYAFACVNVQSQGAGALLNDIVETSIELYPYNESRDFAAPIICGLTYGHFVGSDAHIRAMNWAPEGSTIVLLEGVYVGSLTVSKTNITLEGRGAVITAPTASALIVNAEGFTGKNLGFDSCATAVEIQSGLTTSILQPKFTSAVTTKIKAPANLSGGNLYLEGAKTWYVSDGSNGFWVGDFNGVTAIQHAHDAATAGDKIVIFRGTYDAVTVSKSHLTIGGFDAGVYVRGLTVTGDNNYFSFLRLQTLGIVCSGNYNHFTDTVTFEPSVSTTIKFAETLTQRHFNSHPLVCGNQNEFTVGDGIVSWGDFVGQNAINLALTSAPSGSVIKVLAGEYNKVAAQCNGIRLIGAGNASKISAAVSISDTAIMACMTITGSNNRISDFFLYANDNSLVDFTALGVLVFGSYNLFENITFDTGTNYRIESHRQFSVSSGFHNNEFSPHTGSPTSYVSWTVGDGIHSTGDFIGSGGIQAALDALPNKPRGTRGSLVLSGSGSQTIFTDSYFLNAFYQAYSSLPSQGFTVVDLYRHINISQAANAINIGAFRIIEVISYTSVRLERLDGHSFVDETGVTWDCTAGAKILVHSGNYLPFEISRNHVELEGWPDANVVGMPPSANIITVTGSQCRVKGFRLCCGTPAAYGFNVTGSFNTFVDNQIETANRYRFTNETNKTDSYEARDKDCITVGRLPSQSDVYAPDTNADAAINQAIVLAQSVGLNRVVLKQGTYTLAQSINVPQGMTLEGSGYNTVLVGDGTFAAVYLQGLVGTVGGQSVHKIKFSNFTYAVSGLVTNVFIDHNWFQSAGISLTLAGSLTPNLIM